jgi:outer membrane lipoprotein-sorting protein
LKLLNPAFLPVLVLCLTTATAQDTDLTIDQIVQKHVDAMGGADKIKAIQNVKATGNASLMGGQIEAPVTMLLKRPNSMRLDMMVQDKSFVQGFDGTTSWMINPFMGSPDPHKASDEDAKATRDDSDFIDGPLTDYKAKGNTLELLGKEDVDGTPAYKIKITKKSGNVQFLYLDAKTFLDLKSTGHRRQMGQEMDVETTLGNYKPVNGVQMPYMIAQKANGNPVMQFTVEKYEVNVPVDDAVFHMPEKPKEQAPEKPVEKP